MTPSPRPRFTLDLALPPDRVVARVRAHLAKDRRFVGKLHRRTIFLTIHPRAAHFWSPHLDVQLTKADGGTRLAAIFGPHPQIWGVFVSLQLLFAMLSAGAFAFVASIYLIGDDLTRPLEALGGCLVGGALSFGAAWVGQTLGSEQMTELRAFLDRALADG